MTTSFEQLKTGQNLVQAFEQASGLRISFPNISVQENNGSEEFVILTGGAYSEMDASADAYDKGMKALHNAAQELNKQFGQCCEVKEQDNGVPLTIRIDAGHIERAADFIKQTFKPNR